MFSRHSPKEKTYMGFATLHKCKKRRFEMIEKTYSFHQSDEKMIEQIVDDDNLVINHIILTKDTSLPIHYSNSNVYLIVIRGQMTISLNEQEAQKYSKGSIVNVPYKTKMNINNYDDDLLEFFVVKSPNPKEMIKNDD